MLLFGGVEADELNGDDERHAIGQRQLAPD